MKRLRRFGIELIHSHIAVGLSLRLIQRECGMSYATLVTYRFARRFYPRLFAVLDMHEAGTGLERYTDFRTWRAEHPDGRLSYTEREVVWNRKLRERCEELCRLARCGGVEPSAILALMPKSFQSTVKSVSVWEW